jgi:hypothetical protein
MSKIFLALPIYRECPVDFMVKVHKAIGAKVVHNIAFKMGDSLVSRARNNLTHDFIKSDCEYMLQIDSDIVFTNEQIKRLASHELPIVGGLYSIKDESQRWCSNSLINAKPDSKGLLRVRETGTGFLLVHRDVFHAIREDHIDRIYKCDMDKEIKFDYWAVGVRNGRYLSEDWWFCKDARDAGFEVMVDTKIQVGHLGIASYPIKRNKTNESTRNNNRN